MIQAPAKIESGQEIKQKKVEKDNIFLEILYNLAVQLPIIAVTWVISKIDWD
jgi:hypothetical protein